MDRPGVLDADPPALTPADAEAVARELYGRDGRARLLVSERDQNWLLSTDGGEQLVLKVSNAAEEPGVVSMEVAAVEHVARTAPDLPVPRAIPTLAGEPIGHARIGAADHLVRLIPFFTGANVLPGDLSMRMVREVGVVTGRLSHALRGFFHPAAGRVIAWDQKHLPSLFDHARLVTDQHRRTLLDEVLDRFRANVLPALPGLRAQVIHNDLTLDNLLMQGEAVTGIIDFGDMAHTAVVLDVPATLQSLVRDRLDVFAVADAFLAGYTSVVPLHRDEALLLGDLLAGRMAQTILISVYRTRRYPDNAYITGWAEPAWELLEQLRDVGFDAAGERLAAAALAPPVGERPSPSSAALLARRPTVLGRALAPLTYARPLHLVRGQGTWMYDADGRGFLDAYNNVPVVGHAHPRVADAVGRQAATLNTNTRYLHALVVELAERLAASMPDGLDTVMFVNSGSEANDLAWRLATVATGGEGGLVADWAYHGVTAVIDDLSPSEWRHGRQPRGVETFPAPDTFRGSGLSREDAAAGVAAAVDRLRARGVAAAALYLDGMFTSSGIFAPPAASVAALVGAARDAGALYVADEVQAGHGRSGSGLWTFPAWEVVPDIVTLGKPMGNGFPVAAVITRAELAERLGRVTEFFSTFGGNPVACAAALAVLDVIEDEELVENASRTGALLRDGLASLSSRHPAIADVRGRGLMVGVELVDGDGAPDAGLAGRVRDGMRERGVLIGTTRREGNVLKIRPPLCITPDEAETIVRTLDATLGG